MLVRKPAKSVTTAAELVVAGFVTALGITEDNNAAPAGDPESVSTAMEQEFIWVEDSSWEL